jgi:two-component system CheB/CheR fusion protein
VLQLEPRTDSAARHLPIDNFFRSLAQAQRNKAVAVVLSGMGSDGVAGLKIIKESGGATFCQDEPSAQHQSMPAAAINSGFVDFVATPRKIAAALRRLARDLPSNGSKGRSIPESSLKSLFTLLRAKTEVDFSQYRKTTVRRMNSSESVEEELC